MTSTAAAVGGTVAVSLKSELKRRFKEAATGGAVLTATELAQLSAVTRIGGDFFSGNLFRGCQGITKLDLSPLRNVTSVGEAFLFVWKFREEDTIAMYDYDAEGNLHKNVKLKEYADKKMKPRSTI